MHFLFLPPETEMATQYNNIVRRLAAFDMTVVTTRDEHIVNRTIEKHPALILQCPLEHKSTIRTSSLANKLLKFEKEDLTNFCVPCDKPEISGEELSARDRCAELGLKFIEYQKITHNTRTVKYQCPCGNITTTHVSNLMRETRKGHCLKCQNVPFRNDEEKVRQAFADAGCVLVSEYTNRHKPVEYICKCGKVAKIRYADFTKGKTCIDCKTKKYKATCQEKHGVDNMFQLEETKEKSKKTCMKKYGVEYCTQSLEVQKKAMSTALHSNKKFTWGGYTWTVQGYEPFCIEDLVQDHKPNDIVAGLDHEQDVPSCPYKFNDKKCVWHPDIYIPSEHLIVEVKSEYTYNKCPARIKAKMEHCTYDCELRIYSPKKELLVRVFRDAASGEFINMLDDDFIVGEPY